AEENRNITQRNGSIITECQKRLQTYTIRPGSRPGAFS
ncbi:unnamed protein product, partial [Allacma fusca]